MVRDEIKDLITSWFEKEYANLTKLHLDYGEKSDVDNGAIDLTEMILNIVNDATEEERETGIWSFEREPEECPDNCSGKWFEEDGIVYCATCSRQLC